MDDMSDSDVQEKPVRCIKFRQQELWALKPVWSPRCVVSMYMVVAALFIPVGVVILLQSSRMSHTDRLRYDNAPGCELGDSVNATTVGACVLPIVLERDTSGPSYLYYGLNNFFQNSRNYQSSRSAKQLRGAAGPDTSACSGGDAIEAAVPCGLTANSVFNDTFRLCTTAACAPGDVVALRKDGIAWGVDKSKRFLAGDVNGTDGYTAESNALVTDEDFMVWMRLATYNNFHKLYRVIEADLPAGTYYIEATTRFPVSSFSGEKFVFIAETRWFGGRSRFLGYAYIVVGSVALLLAVLFLVRAGTAKKLDLPPETSVPLDGYARARDSSSGGAAALAPPPGHVVALDPADDPIFEGARRVTDSE